VDVPVGTAPEPKTPVVTAVPIDPGAALTEPIPALLPRALTSACGLKGGAIGLGPSHGRNSTRLDKAFPLGVSALTLGPVDGQNGIATDRH